MQSNAFILKHNSHGAITGLEMINDPVKMNWVIDPEYLKSVDYHHDDKLFGEFDLNIDGISIKSIEQTNCILATQDDLIVEYCLEQVVIRLHYQLTGDSLAWKITLQNKTTHEIGINHFSVWASLAYIMFRDADVHRNSQKSAAVFPSVSPHFTKIAAVRRDNIAPHLGIFQTSGEVLSVGTYNEFTNLFFENVSPSLDGMLFHKLILANSRSPEQIAGRDWLYPEKSIGLAPEAQVEWSFELTSFSGQDNFYRVAQKYGHPYIKYEPMVQSGKKQHLSVYPAADSAIKSIVSQHYSSSGIVSEHISCNSEGQRVEFTPYIPGEHQVVVTLADDRQDTVIFNAIPEINHILDKRVNYLSEVSFAGASGKVPFSFTPLSVQGESLGKMNFILQMLLVKKDDPSATDKVRQVEQSAVHYVKNKWFVDGDFSQPALLYGDFYRVLDFDYIGHLFFLLSRFSDEVLSLESSDTYLKWAAEVLNLRCNPALHHDERAAAEAEIPGVAFLYVNELLNSLKDNGLTEEYLSLSEIWERTLTHIDSDSINLTAAITEHFYDNAGFGPAAASLALSGRNEAAGRYADLLEANIGFSNDFRAQNPDRWWEALSYMIHTLWGGLATSAALICGVKLNRPQLIEAAYRATAGILYMYDWNATSTARKLSPGEAASTFSVAGPNINRPDLSRNRFGQSIFASDGGIFARIFTEGYTGEDDWDCGEELVAYLQGFGQHTYLYTSDEGLRIVNGELEPLSKGRYLVKSYAPWPAEYVMVTTNNTVKSSASSVIYDAENDLFLVNNESLN